MPSQPMVLQAADVRLALGARLVLDGVTLALAEYETAAVQGASGSGKTTLMRVLAGIQAPDSGFVRFDGREITGLPDEDLSRLRLRSFGFVFQFADLVPELTLRENIALPLEFLGVRRDQRRRRVDALVDMMAIQECADLLPHVVSGGERQRAAVARAVVHYPKVLFADEPTGSLDTRARDAVLSLLMGVVRETGCALLLVTHDPFVASRCGQTLNLVDGQFRAARSLDDA